MYPLFLFVWVIIICRCVPSQKPIQRNSTVASVTRCSMQGWAEFPSVWQTEWVCVSVCVTRSFVPSGGFLWLPPAELQGPVQARQGGGEYETPMKACALRGPVCSGGSPDVLLCNYFPSLSAVWRDGSHTQDPGAEVSVHRLLEYSQVCAKIGLDLRKSCHLCLFLIINSGSISLSVINQTHTHTHMCIWIFTYMDIQNIVYIKYYFSILNIFFNI